MRWNNSELLYEKEGDFLHDSDGEMLFAYSSELYVEEGLEIKSLTLSPSVTTINAKVTAAVVVDDGFKEGTM